MALMDSFSQELQVATWWDHSLSEEPQGTTWLDQQVKARLSEKYNQLINKLLGKTSPVVFSALLVFKITKASSKHLASVREIHCLRSAGRNPGNG